MFITFFTTLNLRKLLLVFHVEKYVFLRVNQRTSAAYRKVQACYVCGFQPFCGSMVAVTGSQKVTKTLQ